MVAPAVVVVGQSARPTRRRILIGEEEEEGRPAAGQVTFFAPAVAQLIIRRNPGTFVGVPEDPELEDLAYPGFRAALDSGFNFDPNLSVEENMRRV